MHTSGSATTSSCAPSTSYAPTHNLRMHVASRLPRVHNRGALQVLAAKLNKSALRDIPTVTTLEWQSPLTILKYPDPRLRAVNAKIGVFDDSLVRLAKEMIQIMYTDDGVGLAAPQVGVNVRLMVFNKYGRDKPGNEIILVNPEIVESSVDKELGQEGCLSFPAIYGEVERSREITVKAVNEMGEAVRLPLKGWPARIFQHEYDHLQGVLFPDRMKPLVVESVRSSLVDMEDAYVAAHPGVKVQRLPKPTVNKGFGKK